MTDLEKIVCTACEHEVDARARSCPFCGVDPRTGVRPPPRPGAERILRKKRPPTAGEKVASAVRSRGGLLLGFSIVLGLVLLILLSNWVDRRQQASSDVQPVPLTEVTDLAADSQDTGPPLEMPEIEFQYDGDPSAMETFVMEDGEVPPERPDDDEAKE